MHFLSKYFQAFILAFSLSAYNLSYAWKPAYHPEPVEAYSEDSSKYLRIERPRRDYGDSLSLVQILDWKNAHVLLDTFQISTNYLRPEALISNDGQYWVLVYDLSASIGDGPKVLIEFFSCSSLPVKTISSLDLYPPKWTEWRGATYQIQENGELIISIRANRSSDKIQNHIIRLSDGEILQ